MYLKLNIRTHQMLSTLHEYSEYSGMYNIAKTNHFKSKLYEVVFFLDISGVSNGKLYSFFVISTEQYYQKQIQL